MENKRFYYRKHWRRQGGEGGQTKDMYPELKQNSEWNMPNIENWSFPSA
jgi:hypothetical protein